MFYLVLPIILFTFGLIVKGAAGFVTGMIGVGGVAAWIYNYFRPDVQKDKAVRIRYLQEMSQNVAKEVAGATIAPPDSDWMWECTYKGGFKPIAATGDPACLVALDEGLLIFLRFSLSPLGPPSPNTPVMRPIWIPRESIVGSGMADQQTLGSFVNLGLISFPISGRERGIFIHYRDANGVEHCPVFAGLSDFDLEKAAARLYSYEVAAKRPGMVQSGGPPVLGTATKRTLSFKEVAYLAAGVLVSCLVAMFGFGVYKGSLGDLLVWIMLGCLLVLAFAAARWVFDRIRSSESG